MPKSHIRITKKCSKDLSEVDERELRGQPKTARSRTVKAESVIMRSWSQKRMDHFSCSVAQLLATHQEPRRDRRDPGHKTLPNNGKITNQKLTKLSITYNKRTFCRAIQKGRGNDKIPKVNSKSNDDK